jgi:HK97 family phage portal protein
MALWRNLFGLWSGAGARQKGTQNPAPSSGYDIPVPVTLESALQLSAVWACVRLVSESVASLPIKVYKLKSTGERELDKEHPLSVLFSGRVNRWQTRQEFFETMMYQFVLLGNCYAVIQRNKQNQITSLIPLMSQQMQVDLLDDGAVVYKYTETNGIRVYSGETLWHNKLFGNGIVGLSPLAFAKNSVSIGQAAETSTGKIYKNGGKPSGILTIDKILTKDQREQIKKNFGEMADGNNDRLFVLEADMKYTQVSLSPQDIELLASRRFQIEDIARFFGVPSVLINDTTAATTWGSGIEQIVQGFYKLGLRPYLERMEASMMVNLLTPQERAEYEIEFDFDALLQPSLAERIKSYKEAIQGGFYAPNETRKMEGLAPKEGGDSIFMQSQMTPIQFLPIANGGKQNAGTN